MAAPFDGGRNVYAAGLLERSSCSWPSGSASSAPATPSRRPLSGRDSMPTKSPNAMQAKAKAACLLAMRVALAGCAEPSGQEEQGPALLIDADRPDTGFFDVATG